MAEKLKHETVKGGKIGRSAKTGRFVMVSTARGNDKASPLTESVVKGASSKRKEAMKRLVNR
ncbi:hypothetical protein PXK00_16420 [Phaeobacter sp. QD34_3]|uniref:hypothetical protein n=1 Tax=unclassified Phaeobacter TaxID=2621772 RepID=UPI00237FD604|nr:MULTISPECIES: hypothetical protein [unclassified Phaeobacter]MDE4134703.1 hypothetical protein [Phaeobacter sp. QD34_3]MDE4138327.1 hypothetical protein [Phaeobacter sp. QD34_24]